MNEQESIEKQEENGKKIFFDRERQLRMLKFVIVSAGGLGLNYLILFLMMLLFDHYFVEDVFFTVWFVNVTKVLVSQAIAIVIVMVYNYIINKL